MYVGVFVGVVCLVLFCVRFPCLYCCMCVFVCLCVSPFCVRVACPLFFFFAYVFVFLLLRFAWLLGVCFSSVCMCSPPVLLICVFCFVCAAFVFVCMVLLVCGLVFSFCRFACLFVCVFFVSPPYLFCC